ncbi:ABC transporter substrate-binding protein [Paracoccus aminophilus]|uniref:ABC-type dipeptide transport system, extracellular solute-binding protein n=1 Tax=Paracoccus aminophilus JCM 7686 TaxID=1367847 RepID=S5YHB4_PARAH|nr:ABC transporter substrate-binding protein [Paracoccus aminophilus]AGT10858.1 ABC-type dipeptide transport system, extracellular solute-binding protein [Paracoccus aminophilus JCM 7686]
MTIKMTRRQLGAGGFALALLASYGLPLAAEPKAGGTLTFGLENEPQTLNPHIHNLAKTKMLIRNVYEPLLSRTAEGDYLPWLATGYEISADGKTYRFTLRKGVTFSDGTPLDAEVVALNFRRFGDADYTAALSTGPIAYLKEARAAAPDVVELELTEPYAAFLSFAAALELISAPSFDAEELKAGGKAVAGTGPFLLENYVKGQEISYTRRPDYNWAPENAAHQGPAHLERVVYRFLPESSVRVGALQSGQVDAIEGISGNDAELFDGQPGFLYLSALNGGTPYTLFFNVAHQDTADLGLRQALVAAIDLDAVLASVYRGRRTRAWGIASPVDRLVYDASIEGTYGNDPEKAGKLLDAAGWSARDAEGYRIKDGRRLVLELIQNQTTLRDQRDVLIQALQAQLRQKAGVELQIRSLDAGSYANIRKTNEYNALANSNISAEGYGFDIHYLPYDKGGRNNASNSDDAEIIALLAEARGESDAKKRFEIYAKLQHRALIEQSYNLPLYISEDQIGAGDHVQGLGFRPYHQLIESAYDTWLDR